MKFEVYKQMKFHVNYIYIALFLTQQHNHLNSGSFHIGKQAYNIQYSILSEVFIIKYF